jgi:AcrR family transcriptional regulator
MARTRAGLLDAAATVLAERPPKQVAMADIAAAAGVAKGTLYNHFRTKADVWAALAEREIGRLADACTEVCTEVGGEPGGTRGGSPAGTVGRDSRLSEALVLAARAVATHPGLRQVAAHEPGALLELVTSRRDSPPWLAARRAVDALLAGAGRDRSGADLVLRWLSSYLWAPGGDPTGPATMIAASIPPAPIPPNPDVSPARP